MPHLFDLVIILLLFLVNASLVIYVVGPLLLLQPARRKKEWYARFTTLLNPSDASMPFEEITVTTPDGIDLSCWWIGRASEAKGTILYLHGVGDCKIGGIALAGLLFRSGYNVFLYDSRAHGESGSAFCTYGYYEKRDVATVIDYLEKRKDARLGKIGVFGTSMGAAVAIQAAAIEPRVAGVVAEASFTDLRTIFVDYQRRIVKLPWHFLRNVAMTRSQRIANFKGRLVSPLEDLKRITVPLLFIHGTKDSFIKPEYSQELFEAAKEPKQLLLIEGADHNDVWDVGGKKYENTIVSFFDHALKS
ncbi:MAG: alpha/beta fold hydrolase [Ignavibacteriales bacterium]|nr:alpha/beta fold hydrolase [Ignavibacteriales bacterium]